MRLPPAVVAVLSARVVVGEPAQAFPFLTVDPDGAPHVALVSSTEVRVTGDGAELHVVLGGRRSRRYLEAGGRATLLVVEGTTLHTCKLALVANTEHEGAFAAALGLIDHGADSIGVELTPLGFTPPPDIASLERWEVTAAALDAIHQIRSPS